MQFRRFDVPPDIPPRERFDFWRTWYLDAVDAPVRLDPLTSSPPDFRSRAEVLTVGRVTIVDLYSGPAASSWARSTTESADLLRISLLYRAPGMSVQVHDHDLQVADTGMLLTGRTAGSWRAPAGVRQIQVAVPRAALPFDDRTVERVVRYPLTPGPPVVDTLVRPMMAGMVGRLEELSRPASDDLARIWTSLVTMLVRTLADAPVDDANTAAGRLTQVRRFIQANLADPTLGPDPVAAALHVSRRRLYQLVERDGEAVAEMIRRARLRRAAEILRDPAQRHLPIAEVGAAVGLPRPAHFSRLVRAEYGCSPRELRARAVCSP